jgi:hypothetical protein
MEANCSISTRLNNTPHTSCSLIDSHNYNHPPVSLPDAIHPNPLCAHKMSCCLSQIPVIPLSILLVILTLPHSCLSKFSTTYPGTATTGLETCLANSTFTSETIVLHEHCREAFKCIMDNIPNFGQSILSSGAAILGFVRASQTPPPSLPKSKR